MAILASQYRNSFIFCLLGCQELITLQPSHTVQRWRCFCCHNWDSKFAEMRLGKCGRYEICNSNWMSFLEQIFKVLNWQCTYQWFTGSSWTQRVQKKIPKHGFMTPKTIEVNKVYTLVCCTDWVLILYFSLLKTRKNICALCKLENAQLTHLDKYTVVCSTCTVDTGQYF